ncbi:MAG: NAD-dependent epimerase/dehydratase family protein [Gemmatimonadota bacterium]
MPDLALVTGATGFVGSHLSERLVADGYAVRAMARASSDTTHLAALGVEIVHADLLDEDAVGRTVDGCTHVYHLAAATARSHPSTEDYRVINETGTRHMTQASVAAGIRRFVFASTLGGFGRVPQPPADERTPPQPNTAYRISKWRAEQIVHDAVKSQGLPAVIARLPSMLGARARGWLPWVRDIAAGRVFVVGSGSNRVPLTAVSDAVDALRLCAEIPGIEGRTYLFTGPDCVSINRAIAAIARSLDVSATPRRLPALPLRLYHRLGDALYRRLGLSLPRTHALEFFQADRAFSIERARRELGYDPRVSIEDAMQQTVNWYLQEGLL